MIINDPSIGGTDSSNLFADPAVGPNGELYVSWHDIDGGTIEFDVDRDGLFSFNDAFGADVTAVTLNSSFFKYSVPAQPNRVIFNGPNMDVDRSGGAFDGRIYITYVDEFSDPTSTSSSFRPTTRGRPGPVRQRRFQSWYRVPALGRWVDRTTGSVNVRLLLDRQ